MAHKTKLTQKLIGKFLELLANNGGIVQDAAKDLNISRTALYNKRNRETKFKEIWDEAVDRGIDLLEDEAKRRALNGTEEPIFYEGEMVGTKRYYSDYLTAFILKGHRPKYKERHEISGPDGGPITTSATVVFMPDNKRDKSKSSSKNKP